MPRQPGVEGITCWNGFKLQQFCFMQGDDSPTQTGLCPIDAFHPEIRHGQAAGQLMGRRLIRPNLERAAELSERQQLAVRRADKLLLEQPESN